MSRDGRDIHKQYVMINLFGIHLFFLQKYAIRKPDANEKLCNGLFKHRLITKFGFRLIQHIQINRE
jgi:hypothetical protein